MLREHDIASMDPVAPHYIADSVRSALQHGYHVVLEGILHADRYGTVLRQLIAEHTGPSHVFYLDVPLEETLRRHQARAASVRFTPDDMRGWYTEHDVLDIAGEHVIDDTATFEDTVTTILRVSGLAGAVPLAPCPVRCPHCAAKESAATPHPTAARSMMLPDAAAPITVAALAIVPAGDGRLAFVRQQPG